MNKYFLVGFCLLAFVAGSAAQLALHRSGGDATPAPTQTIAAASAQPENNQPAAQPAARPAEPQAEQAAPEASAKMEVIEDVQSGAAAEVAEGGDLSGGTIRASRQAGAVRSRTGLRATRTNSRPGAAQAPTRAVSRDGGVHQKAASGVKKTGRWFGKSLKKLGGVFHD